MKTKERQRRKNHGEKDATTEKGYMRYTTKDIVVFSLRCFPDVLDESPIPRFQKTKKNTYPVLNKKRKHENAELLHQDPKRNSRTQFQIPGHNFSSWVITRDQHTLLCCIFPILGHLRERPCPFTPLASF